MELKTKTIAAESKIKEKEITNIVALHGKANNTDKWSGRLRNAAAASAVLLLLYATHHHQQQAETMMVFLQIR